MPMTITCTDGAINVSSTLSDELVGIIDQNRQTIGTYLNGVFQVTYPDIPSYFAGIVNTYIVVPALKKNPTAALQTAKENLATAQSALDSARRVME